MLFHCNTLGWIIVARLVIRVLGNPPVNDPLYERQKPYLKATNIPGAWTRLVSTRVKRENATIALIESGVQSDHPDLAANVIKGYNVITHNDDTHDTDGHGTNQAGVLGAMINNSIGLAGVIDLVNIMPISYGAIPTLQSIADSIDYVIRNKVRYNTKIILLATSATQTSPQLTAKIQEADAAGILMVVTAGNSGKDISINKRYPCSLTVNLKGMLCVASMEQTAMRLEVGSNYADYLDIAAPGTDIVTTVLGDLYGRTTGTSPAAALVAGVAAMLYSLAPGLASGDVKKILQSTAKKGVKSSNGRITFPFGRIDADKAVAKLIPR